LVHRRAHFVVIGLAAAVVAGHGLYHLSGFGVVAPAKVSVRASGEERPVLRVGCAAHPPPMDVAEWQRLVRDLRAHIDLEEARRPSPMRQENLELVERAESCDVAFDQRHEVMRGGNLLVRTAFGDLWLGANFVKRESGWAFLSLDGGDIR